ncbi:MULTISPECIES: DoxX family protein [unclassified Azospirillum]|uniref:DoxX family protein n=1 Tax=unclassified Azospirillum TaxID=2630922 RepID=UPI000B6CB359|nr:MULTISPECIES: DoxX family protein [unclassified Azospirillum]SNS92813.1 putative oxidoreductase [Azospirillum sp. RU38E]SNT09663.1 putative oxidoreductase [Azospirillum sp. RU37A]
MPTKNSERYAPHALALLRVIAALLFMQHGLQKLIKFPDAGHHPGPFELFTLAGVAGILETFGGLAILLGLFTRPVAFVLSGQMAVAYFMFHFANGIAKPMGFFPVVNGGDLAILFCFVFLYLSVAGSGSFSLDGKRARRGA